MSDVLKLNDEELAVIGSICGVKGSEAVMLRTLFEKYRLEMAVLTKGKKGSRLLSHDYEEELPAPSVEVADTVGAGDAFTAAVVVGMLKNIPPQDIHVCATELAAYVCTQKGATPRLMPDIRSKLDTIINL